MRIRYFIAKRGNIANLDTLNKLSMPENYDKTFWENIISEHLSWVAKCGQEIVGYILIGTCHSELSIISLAVATSHQARGIANHLLTIAIEQISNRYKTKKINLAVRVGNAAAIHLYNKHGFKSSEQLADYYCDPTEDAYQMIRLQSTC